MIQKRVSSKMLIVAFIAVLSISAAAGYAAAGSAIYRGNTKTRIFHRPGCRYYDCRNCTAEFSGRDEAVAAGYRPCKVCKP